jgi:hypothetical protein
MPFYILPEYAGIVWPLAELDAKLFLPNKSNTFVWELECMLACAQGCPALEVQLYHDGHELSYSRMLSHYNIESGGSIVVRRQLRITGVAHVDNVAHFFQYKTDATTTVGNFKAQIGREYGIDQGTALLADLESWSTWGGAIRFADNAELVRTALSSMRTTIWFRRRIRPSTREDGTPYAPYISVAVKPVGTPEATDVTAAGVTPAWTVMELKALLCTKGVAPSMKSSISTGDTTLAECDEDKTLEAVGCTADELSLQLLHGV